MSNVSERSSDSKERDRSGSPPILPRDQWLIVLIQGRKSSVFVVWGTNEVMVLAMAVMSDRGMGGETKKFR